MEFIILRETCFILMYYLLINLLLRDADCAEVLRMANFRRETALDDRVCDVTDILFDENAFSAIGCGLICLDKSSCVTIFYNSAVEKCYGCNGTYSGTNPPPVSSGNVHYQLYPSCDEGWTGFLRSCYKITPKGSFYEGVSQCEADGGHAVYIETAVEGDFVKQQAVLDTDANTWSWYIGVTDCEIDGVWKYYGSDVTADFLDFRTPAESVGDCCVVIFEGYDYHWSPFSCVHASYPWATICEIDISY